MGNSATVASFGQSASSRWRHAAFVAAMLILALGALTTPAAADILPFTDLGPACSPNIPAVYHGLNWSSNFQLECNSDFASSYSNSYGAASGYAATNGGALGSGLSGISIGAGTFDFVSADFTSFAGSNSFQSYSAESLQIYAYRPGDTVDNPTFVTALDLDPTQYVTATLNFTGIDDLFFGAGNGPAADPNTIFGVDGLSWLMTNTVLNQDLPGDVPEPASILLLGTCLAAGLFVRGAPKGSLKP